MFKYVLLNGFVVKEGEPDDLAFPADYDTVVETLKPLLVGDVFVSTFSQTVEVALQQGAYVKHVEGTYGLSYVDPSYQVVYEEVGEAPFMRSLSSKGTKHYYRGLAGFQLPDGITPDEVVYTAERGTEETEFYLSFSVERAEALGFKQAFGSYWPLAVSQAAGWASKGVSVSLQGELRTAYLQLQVHQLEGVDTSVPLVKPVTSITPRQLRRQLLKDGLLSNVETLLESLPEPSRSEAKIDFEYATEVKRYAPLTLQIAEALSLTHAQVDTMFIEASKYD